MYNTGTILTPYSSALNKVSKFDSSTIHTARQLGHIFVGMLRTVRTQYTWCEYLSWY